MPDPKLEWMTGTADENGYAIGEQVFSANWCRRGKQMVVGGGE